jgi:hypothetical protein
LCKGTSGRDGQSLGGFVTIGERVLVEGELFVGHALQFFREEATDRNDSGLYRLFRKMEIRRTVLGTVDKTRILAVRLRFGLSGMKAKSRRCLKREASCNHALWTEMWKTSGNGGLA